MSLTSLLGRDQDIKRRLKEEFAKPRLKAERALLAPPQSKNYALVGTAFDYLLRFHVKRLNPEALGGETWVAETALDFLSGGLRRRGEEITSRAREERKTYLETGAVTDRLLQSVLALARLDPIFRAGRGHEYLNAPIDGKDVKDLRSLLSIVPDDAFRAENLCLLNPTFGEGSRLVGGADADLVIDQTLIDVKTTKNFKLERKVFNQLLGYYTLHKLGQVGELDTRPEITRLAIYFSRHAYLYVIKVDEVIDEETFPAFARWFEEHVRSRYLRRV